MPGTATANSAPTTVLQGIEVPTTSIDPAQFFARTRRLSYLVKTSAFAGLGSTDNIPIQQAGIISGLRVRFVGSLVTTPGTGTAATSARWPYDLVRGFRFSANGQSNLINASGWKLKAREFMARGDLNDRGVVQRIGAGNVQQGTLSLASETWGVGQNQSGLTGATTPIELEWYLPIAFDDVSLVGAIFAQTSATDLQLSIDWANASDIFVVTGNATMVLSGSYVVESKTYTIPQAPNGSVIVPDLSTFHSITQSRFTGPGNGDNEVRLAGQGVGKQLMRLWWQLWNGAAPGAPVPVNATNFGNLAWRFGGNDTPEVMRDGSSMNHEMERTFGVDMGTLAGFAGFDFASENAFRDSVDEATATELRFLMNIANGVSLTNPSIEYVQETLSNGASV
jgi:hypothetical protein